MTPSEESERLDRVCELIDIAMQALNGHDDDAARIGKTALRMAKSECCLLKDEALLAEALFKKNRIPSTKPPRKPRKK